MRPSLLLAFFLVGCGRVEGSSPSDPPPDGSTTTPPSSNDTDGTATKPKGSGSVNFYVVEGQAFASARFYAEPPPKAEPVAPGCVFYRPNDGGPTPREVSAGKVTVSGVADGRPFSVPLGWDAKKRAYDDAGSFVDLPGTQIDTLRYQASGDEAPAFDTLLEALPPVAIAEPAEAAVVDGEDLVVKWRTTGNATVLVSLMLGGVGSVDCTVPGTSREVTLPRALVREALESRRVAGEPPTCPNERPCATLIVGAFTGARVKADGWDIAVSHAQMAGRMLDIAPK